MTRRLLGRLHDHGVAGDQRRGGHAGEDRQRKVPRRDDGGHAARHVDEPILLARHIDFLAAFQCASRRGRSIRRNRSPRTRRHRLRARPCRIRKLPRRPARSAAGAFPPPLRAEIRPAAAAPCADQSGSARFAAATAADGMLRLRGRHVADRLRNIRRIARDDFGSRFHVLAVDHQRIRTAQLRLHLGQVPRAWRSRLRSMAKSAGGSLRNAGKPRRRDRRFARVIGDSAPIASRLHDRLRCSSGFISKFSGGTCFGKTGPQERIVRSVFQQPPHQVGHAGNQLAVGHVNSQAIAGVDQRLLFGVGHAVEHLQFEGVARQAEVFGRGNAVGQRADVVAAQRRPQVLVIPHQKPREPLEIGVRLPLLLKHRDRPAGRPAWTVS